MTFTPVVQPGWLRRNRLAVGIGSALVVVLVLLGLLTLGGPHGELDPDAYDPPGAHALSVLLDDYGIPVRRTSDVPSTRTLADDATTVFVPLPWLLSDDELDAVSALPGHLVVAGATDRELQRLDDRVQAASQPQVVARDPGCDLPAARRAGRAELGGVSYEGSGTSCYDGTVLSLKDSQLTLLGSAEFMTNDRLDVAGNAALALRLLGTGRAVVWLVPAQDRAAFGVRPVRSPNDVLPAWPGRVAWELLVVVVLLAAWRGRRLGRVVPEPLPVVVHAAETVEGRGRLYRAANARATAAEELRAGARRRLGPRVGAGRHPTKDALLAGTQLHSARPAEQISALLYGPEPADDGALMRLATDLDALTREVTGS